MSISAIPPRSAAPPQGEGAKDIASFAPVVSSVVTAREDIVVKNPSSAQVNHAINQVNDAFTERGQNLYASLEKDKETGINVVKLLDKNTKEIVTQYPSKEIVAIAAALTQYQESKGSLLNVSV